MATFASNLVNSLDRSYQLNRPAWGRRSDEPVQVRGRPHFMLLADGPCGCGSNDKRGRSGSFRTGYGTVMPWPLAKPASQPAPHTCSFQIAKLVDYKEVKGGQQYFVEYTVQVRRFVSAGS